MENGRAVDGDEEPLMLMPGNVRHGPLRREAALHTIFIFLFFPVNHFTLTLAPLVQSLVINKRY